MSDDRDQRDDRPPGGPPGGPPGVGGGNQPPNEGAYPRRRADDKRRSQQLAAVRHTIRKEMADLPPGSVIEGDVEGNGQGGPVIELQGVDLAFDYPVLEDISFIVDEGETVAIVGESGTGKSTILKLLLR